MPRVAPEHRKRVYYPKTRTGCLTCKKRRIKCGEEHPACVRCTSTGRQCEGYRDPAASTPPASRNASARPLLARPLSAPSYHSFACNQERRSFQFFIEQTVPQLTGDFECAFWGRLLLQSVHHEPVIRHATVALGSLHEQFECDAAPFRLGTLSTHTAFALRQYLRAIRYLTLTPNHSQPLDICLISCILFACFEAMRDHYGPAITHITSGLHILSELRTNPSTALCANRTPYIPIDILCNLFTRLQGQVIVTVHRIGAARCNLWPDLIINLTQPIIFHSLADARETLELYTYYYRHRSTELQSHPQHQSHPQPPNINPAITLRDTSLILLSHWSTALDTFLHHHSTTLTPRDHRAASVLQLRKIDCFIALDILQAAGQTAAGHHVQWDKYCSFFEQMVVLAESITSASSSTHSTPTMKKTFSLDLSIIAAIFNVAARCRHPIIRRRAVRVLRTSTIQEGVWNSVVVAAIAEKWIDIEEEGLHSVRGCADVPEEARVVDFLPVFDAERLRVEVFFSRMGRRGREVRREVFMW